VGSEGLARGTLSTAFGFPVELGQFVVGASAFCVILMLPRGAISTVLARGGILGLRLSRCRLNSKPARAMPGPAPESRLGAAGGTRRRRRKARRRRRRPRWEGRRCTGPPPAPNAGTGIEPARPGKRARLCAPEAPYGEATEHRRPQVAKRQTASPRNYSPPRLLASAVVREFDAADGTVVAASHSAAILQKSVKVISDGRNRNRRQSSGSSDRKPR
jgi:hypothetical protein